LFLNDLYVDEDVLMFEMEGEVNNDLNVSFGSALNDVVDVVS
jgi:hypothetical protein